MVTFALNDRGAARVDEQQRAIMLSTVLTLAGADDGNFMTPDEFLQSKWARAFASQQPIVAVSSPSDTPPAGSLGYYSDGGEHAAAVVVSSAGRRLFVEVNADSELHTNVAQYLYEGIW